MQTITPTQLVESLPPHRLWEMNPTELREYLQTQPPWTTSSMTEESPVQVPESPTTQWRMILNGFPDGDLLCILRIPTSRRGGWVAPEFRTREEWLRERAFPKTCQVLISPCSFQPGTRRLNKGSVAKSRFVVVSQGTLDRALTGTLFRWLRDEASLNPCAIVDTPRNGLQAWFSHPGIDILRRLRSVLERLGCDERAFGLLKLHPLAGTMDLNRYQRLVYLAPRRTDQDPPPPKPQDDTPITTNPAR